MEISLSTPFSLPVINASANPRLFHIRIPHIRTGNIEISPARNMTPLLPALVLSRIRTPRSPATSPNLSRNLAYSFCQIRKTHCVLHWQGSSPLNPDTGKPEIYHPHLRLRTQKKCRQPPPDLRPLETDSTFSAFQPYDVIGMI